MSRKLPSFRPVSNPGHAARAGIRKLLAMPHRFSEDGYRYWHRYEFTTNGCALRICEMIEQVDSGTTGYQRPLEQCDMKVNREASEQLYQVSPEALPLGGTLTWLP